MKPNMLYPALLGGLFIGVFSALPIISVGNFCCCLWLIVGGVLAAWLMQQNHPAPVTPADGALVGLMAGVVGSFVYLVIALPVGLLFGPMMERWMQAMIDNAGDTPMRDVFERYRGAGMRAVAVLANFALHFILGLIFPTLGGLLGAVLFRKAGPPIPPPPGTTVGGWTPPSPALGPTLAPGPPTATTWTPPAPPVTGGPSEVPRARSEPVPPGGGPDLVPPAPSEPVSPEQPELIPPPPGERVPPEPPELVPPAPREPLPPGAPEPIPPPGGPIVSGPVEPRGPVAQGDTDPDRNGGSGPSTV